MTLIYPMSYELHVYIDKVQQYLVNKYQIIYQNISMGGIVGPHLVELDIYKILEQLKRASG